MEENNTSLDEGGGKCIDFHAVAAFGVSVFCVKKR